MFSFTWHLSPRGVSNGPVSKGVSPLGRGVAEVLSLVCQALMGSLINPHIFSK